MTAGRRPAPLSPGWEVDGLRIAAVLDVGPQLIRYRAVDAATGGNFILEEFAPAGRCRRAEDGSIRPEDGSSPVGLEQDIARNLSRAAGASTVDSPGLARTVRGFRSGGTAWRLYAVPDGALLSTRLAAEPMPPRRVAGLAHDLLAGLEALHDRGVVHGHISPSDVWVGEQGDAMLLGGGATAPVRNDEDWPYAAPDGDDLGAGSGRSADIYGLAATLWHTLAGAPPAPAGKRLAAREAGAPDPLDDLPEGGSRSDRIALDELGILLGRGLRLDPEERPGSVREWRARIEATVPGREPVETAGGPPAGPAVSGWKPLVFAALVLAIVVAAGMFTLVWERESGSEQAAEDAARRAAESAREQERWRQALDANALIGYRVFIDDFPESSRVAQAREYIDALEGRAWPAVLEENTAAGYEAHLENYPDGRYATEAKARIEALREEADRAERAAAERARRDDAAWALASGAGTVAAIDRYLSEWPGGRHAAEARTLRGQMQTERNDDIRFREAREAHTIAAYRGYVADYPGGRHVQAALAAIDGLTLRPGKRFRDCDDCPEMVVVPAGAFWQGSGDGSAWALSLEKPRRRVVIDRPFAIGVHEVTLREWDACVDAGACTTRPDDNGWGRGSRPVMLVSWDDAVGYTDWLSDRTGQAYTLPSESQWEYAARAGEEGDWPGGDPAAVCAWGNVAAAETGFDWRHDACADRMALSTSMAGTFRPNAFGLYDVIGNVAEWTLDCMNLSYLEAPSDGGAWTRGLCSSRMTRGGSWFSGSRDIRFPARFNLKRGDRNDFTGFRVVRRVEPQTE